MAVVGCEVTLVSDDPVSADEISDLIAVLIDELDDLATAPSVSSVGVGTEFVLTIEVDADDADGEIEAFYKGFSAIRAALHAADVGTPGMAVPTGLRPTIRRSLLDA